MWAFVVQIFYMIVTSLIISLFTKPKTQKSEPQNPEGVPNIDDDAIVPVLFGTRMLSQNNVLWWGDTKTTPITKSGGGKK